MSTGSRRNAADALALAFVVALVVVLGACTGSRQQPSVEPARVLRVCADPNNLPFSNDRGEGFENKIAELVAREMSAKLEYTWHAQRRGFVRNTLRAGVCDVIMGVPTSFELAATTRPYYRSTYVFVTRGLRVSSLDHPVLRTARIGVHLIGDDYANPPPMHALARRHIVQNVAGYSLYGNYAEPNPPARLIDAVSNGEVDVAIVWGPFAGYFARKQKVALTITPVSPEIDLPFLPFVFDIAMGIRRGEEGLRLELETILDKREKDIDKILHDYGVPVKAMARGSAGPVGP